MRLDPTDTTRARLPIYALFTANAVSLIGNTLTLIAVPWFVLATTGSASKTGLTTAVTTLPTVLAAFFGGALVDRLGYRRASVAADLASGLTVALIPILYYTTGLAFWQLLVLVFLGALLDTPGHAARVALLPDLAKTAGMPLERANAALQGIQRSASLVGAPLAGILIAATSATDVLLIDALTFGVSAALVAFAVSQPASAKREASSGYASEVLDGLRFVLRDPLLVAVIATVLVTNFLDAPLFAVLLPVYANTVLGSPVSLGLIIAGFGGGALLGTIGYGSVGHRLPRRATFVGCFLALSLPLWVLATLPSFPVAVAATFAMGLAAGPINPVLMTVIQERIPADMRGRVFGTLSAGAYLAIPLGMLLAGYMVEWVGLRSTLLGLAAAYAVVTASMFVNPAFRGMDRTSTNGHE
jgi:MFS family permease